MSRLQWIDRKFSFDFPAELHHEILERLRGTPARVEDRIRALSPEVLTREPEQGWSIQQHIGHLVKVESLVSARLDDYQAGRAELRPAEMSRKRTVEARYNEGPVEALLEELRRVRAGSVARLEALPPEEFAKTAFHQRLGVPMRLVDTMYFFAEHDDHHLARITELLAATAFRSPLRGDS